MMMPANLEELRQTVLDAVSRQTPLCIVGGGSKDFYGRPATGVELCTRGWRGIVAYEPTELFITARAGTPLAEIEAALAEKNQMLAFEPPHFGSAATSSATVGGCIAAGLSGPRRATAGAVRDFVLGVKLLDGKGEVLNFGGQVMKNVAGYDVSRLLAGSMGVLGLISEATLKVMPRPTAEATLMLELPQDRALSLMNAWGGQPLPISATCWMDGRLTVRLSGAAAAVAAARKKIGGVEVGDGDSFWAALREHRLSFFSQANAGDHLWRLSVPSTTPCLSVPGPEVVEWGGALRWTWADAGVAEAMRQLAAESGGHATLFRADSSARRDIGAFQPLQAPLAAIHKNLKRALDPCGIFNPGRLYADF